MGGLGSFNSRGNATYLRIGMGKDDKGRDRAVIGKRAKEGEPGAVPVLFKDEPVMDKDGNAIYRTEHPDIEGQVVKIEREQPEYNGKKVDVLNLHINAGGELFRLQLTQGDDYWLDFALRCADIDWSKTLKLTPYSIPQENNPKYSNRMLVPSQDGVKIKRKWMVKWHREQSEPPTPEPGHPPAYTYDHDEQKWKKRKVWNWLDQNPIQMAIDRVAFLNSSKADIDAQNDAAAYVDPEAADVPDDGEDVAPF